jgi:tRNA dimethylallyltransferase
MARPIPVIVGPTAVGKTDLSIAVAQHVAAEIVSADSRQFYRSLDIGTAKPTAAQRRVIPHHLIDRLNPDEAISAAAFVRLAWGCIHTIEARGRQPLIVGGSGLYVRALTDGLFPGPAAHPQLRAALEAEARVAGTPALHDRLAEVDAPAASRIHPNDRIRIIRALEIYTLTGTPISQWQQQWRRPPRRHDFVLIGLTRTRDDLRQRIAARTQAMLSQGLVDEVTMLLSGGFPPTLAPLQSVGYAELIAYCTGVIDLPRACELIERNTWRLAKRQLTWFRRIEGIHWLSLTEMTEATAVDTITSLLTETWAKPAEVSSSEPLDHQEACCTCGATP